MKHWINQHVQALALVTHRLRAQLVSTLLICAVMGVTLAIPSLIYVVVDNLHHVMSDVKKDAQVSVFLTQDVTEKDTQAIKKALEADANIKAFQYVPKEEALKQLVATSNNSELVATLDSNPLPHAFFVTPTTIDETAISALTASIRALSGVESVMIDSAWMKRLNSLLSIGQKAAWLLGGLLSVALIAVISNIIRMQVLTHKEEIEVSELFGATKSFIRRPFLYLGSLYGLLGGVFACVVVWLVTHLFNQAVVELAAEYQADFSIQLQAVSLFMWILVLATSIGWLASYAAVTVKAR